MLAPARRQQTLARPAVVVGFGYWSGHDVSVEFRPAASGTGIVFIRRDLTPHRRIPALVAQRIEIPRRTTLAADGATVEMVEHILAALAGLQIDNCEVWVDSQEMPGCDGSAEAFVTALAAAGTREQDAPRQQLIVDRVTRVGSDDVWVEARPATTSGLTIQYKLHYPHAPAIGRQTIERPVTPEVFRRDLAPARTFILATEAEQLLKQGLCHRSTCTDLLVFDEAGPIHNALRFPDECVRHKALDLVGDLALAGCDLVGHVTAHCSGHRLNAELVAALLAPSAALRRSA